MLKLLMPVPLVILPMPQLMVSEHCATVCEFFVESSFSFFSMFRPAGPPKTEAQLKKEAKKKEKLEKFQQKKDTEAKKKTQPSTEVRMFNKNNVL